MVATSCEYKDTDLGLACFKISLPCSALSRALDMRE